MPGNAGIIDPFAMPGMGAESDSTENEFLWGNRETAHYESGVIVSTTTDSGSSPTSQLRPGLAMGKVTASGKWGQYDPTATDGREVFQGVLRLGVNMLDNTGTAADKAGIFVIGGFLKNGKVFNLDALARRQGNRFVFDDDLAGVAALWRTVVAKTADYTVLATDNDKIFSNQGAVGAVNFTLPTCARGLHFQFVVEADQNVTITSAPSDILVVFNDAAADSIAFSTGSQKIGGWVEVFANADASKWLVKVGLGSASQTVTIAT